MSLLIKNATLIDPANNINGNHDVLIKDQTIQEIGSNINHDGETIDASNHILIPGLVDLRARFREPGQEHKANIKSEALAAAKSGITSVCLQPDTDPVIDRPSMAKMLIEKGHEINGARIYPIGALTHGLNGKTLSDMWSLSQSGCVGISNALKSVKNALVMRRAMQYAASFDLTVHLYAQDRSLLGNGCIHEGATSTRLGLPAIPAAAEIVGVARDIALVETTGAKTHFMGLSCARSVEMIANAQQQGLPITADVDIHHLVLCEDDMRDFDSNFHIRPPLRTANDRLALQQGIKQGVIQAICSDHQPHDKDSKLTPFSESSAGISGIESLLPLTMKLVADGILDINQAIAAITHVPANILGINAGTLSIGSVADCCLVNTQNEYELTNERLLSSGKNSPYLGSAFKAQVTHTLIGGALVN